MRFIMLGYAAPATKHNRTPRGHWKITEIHYNAMTSLPADWVHPKFASAIFALGGEATCYGRTVAYWLPEKNKPWITPELQLECVYSLVNARRRGEIFRVEVVDNSDNHFLWDGVDLIVGERYKGDGQLRVTPQLNGGPLDITISKKNDNDATDCELNMKEKRGVKFSSSRMEDWASVQQQLLKDGLAAFEKISPVWNADSFLAPYCRALQEKHAAATAKISRLLHQSWGISQQGSSITQGGGLPIRQPEKNAPLSLV